MTRLTTLTGKPVDSAGFSDDRVYRYWLSRSLGPGDGCAVFIGLNPSTADETVDDPTIRRCKQFARDFGCGTLIMLNLFAFRATKPQDMKAANDPIGPANDDALLEHTQHATVVVAAWGAHGSFLGRGKWVRSLLPALHHLRLTKDGHPSHPLYLPASLRPTLWSKP